MSENETAHRGPDIFMKKIPGGWGATIAIAGENAGSAYSEGATPAEAAQNVKKEKERIENKRTERD